MKSFLRWVGGKKQLLNQILPLCPKEYKTYHEPFVGGGALFFAIEPKQAFINDLNHRLVNTYKKVKHHPNDVVGQGQCHEPTEKIYYEQRDLLNLEDINKLDVDCAGRFIYINKKCFNGLWRENRKGNFNVPFCKSNAEVFTEKYVETIHQCSSALKRTRISQGDYSETLKNMNEDDFDPQHQPGARARTASVCVQLGGEPERDSAFQSCLSRRAQQRDVPPDTSSVSTVSTLRRVQFLAGGQLQAKRRRGAGGETILERFNAERHLRVVQADGRLFGALRDPGFLSPAERVVADVEQSAAPDLVQLRL